MINKSTFFDETLPIEIVFTNTSPSAEGKFVTEVDSTSAAIISNVDSLTYLPQWLGELIEQSGWQFDSHESLANVGKTIIDQNGNIVTSFTLYNHNHVADSALAGVKAPTCTEDGYSGDQVCEECGSVMQAGSTIPKLDHNYQNGVCVNCGALDPDAVNLLPVFTAPAGPKDVTVQEGKQSVMSVTATDADSYQWYVNRNDGQGYVAIAGATDATYSISAVKLEDDGYTYYCEATNAYGTIKSPVFTLQVGQSSAQPQTGYDTHAGLWTLLLLSSLGSLSLLTLDRRIRNEER